MFIRRNRQKSGKGVRTHLSLAHNECVDAPGGGKRTRPVVLARLGVEEDLGVEGVERFIAARSWTAQPDETSSASMWRRAAASGFSWGGGGNGGPG